MDSIDKTLRELLRLNKINKYEYTAITQKEAREAEFYLLPKIHKDRMNPLGRPILSGNGHPTEWVSAWVDTQLQPLMLSLPTYLKDTSHLLTLLDNHTLTTNSLIISLDVKSLYTNIPQAEGIDSIREVGHKLMPGTDFHTVSILA